MRLKTERILTIAALIAAVALPAGLFGRLEAAAAADNAEVSESESAGEALVGGGYAATGQIGNVGYTTQMYDASNGLPTSDANFILGAGSGFIWIGGYSGIIRYDGSTFIRMDTSDGLTNGRGLFEDSKGRIWVGTNDNGVVVIDGNESIHLTYKEGLPSSSIRVFTEDNRGNVYIGTTAGVCYADPEMQLHPVDDERLRDERVLKLDSDAQGRVYGQTKNGIIFRIEEARVTGAYTGKELGMETITSILADPRHDGKIYLCTEGDSVYYGDFGDTVLSGMERISTTPLTGAHWISYDCERVWVSSLSQIGYFDEHKAFHVLEGLPMNSGIEMMTSDYQGNMWVASSTQGVMKIVRNSFVDLFEKAGIAEEVTNAVCFHGDDLYIGTNAGIRILDHSGRAISNGLTAYVGDARVRCLKEDRDGNLWISTFSKGLGLVCYGRDGKISRFTTENGMPDDEVRCTAQMSDGTILAGTNGGLAKIRNGRVTETVGAGEDVKNTVFLTVEEGDNGEIYVGTDGDGIYVITGSDVRRIGRDDGLTSDVILRIKKDKTRGVTWIVTSNSIEYLKDGQIREVTSFPYNNNYDLYFDDTDDMWIIASNGIYAVSAADMTGDTVTDYRIYKVENGLTSTPTSNSYSVFDAQGYLYIAGRNGACKVNTKDLSQERIPVKAAISSVTFGGEQIFPEENGTYELPSSEGRIRIDAAVLDYTLLNPMIHVYLEGKENEGIMVARSELKPLEFTGLGYGSYILHVRVLDSAGRNELLDETFRIQKRARLFELPIIRLLALIIVVFATGYIVWRVIKNTVIRRQYDEISRARDEAERANTAKSRFLANMSHEIRTPINTIMGMNEMALREDATGVPKGYFVSMVNYSLDIRNASESLLSLINDILDMSKIESGKMHLGEQEYDTQEMLRSIVSMIRMRSTEKELIFDVTIDEILPSRLYGDAGKIKQIVLNLLTNALKYTDVGGFSLCVSMEEREDDECTLRFSVKDTGIGVKEEDKEKLFTAYERLDEQKNSGIQGTGLGLDISRRFALLMGGTLDCESVYGEGSEFILTVKQRIVDRTPVGVFMEHEDNASKGPYVPQFIAPDADILVVDDTPMNLNVIKGLLKPTRVFVTTAKSGEECLEKIRETKFNVVLLDHMMPGMDGVETVAKIRETDPDLPVYALTANAASGEEFYKSKGFNGYLAKPIDSQTLERTIMRHIPEEMMEKPSQEDAVQELEEMPQEMGWIYETPGLDVEEGIRNSGGISNYIFSLNLFLETIDDNVKVIRQSCQEESIRLYTIKVHSLKSSARIIGAMELSEFAAALEDAGNRDDREFIRENTEKLLSDYEAYREKLERLHSEPDNEDKEMISEKTLRGAYTALAEVIPQMDYDSVEMILSELNEYALPPEDERRVKALTKMLSEFDWDGMEALIGQ
ncbi:MAG: response regulator [Lachnospiraceae bacterium]|nr:response regulator [Lachnospiraceae bacterium]